MSLKFCVFSKGHYKYNTSLLRNIEYVNETKQFVLDVIEKSEDLNFDHRQTWELVKVRFISIAIKHLCKSAESLKKRDQYIRKKLDVSDIPNFVDNGKKEIKEDLDK